MKNPEYIKCYIYKKTKKKWKNYEECYNYYYNEFMDYHNRYGKDGFLSERTYIDTIPLRAENQAKFDMEIERNISENVPILYVGKIRIFRETEKEQMAEIESRLDFVKWMN